MAQLKYQKIAEALYESFHQNPFHNTLWKTVSDDEYIIRATMIEYMNYSMIEAEKYGILYLPETHEFGTSIWFKPLNKETASKKSTERKKFLLENLGEKFLIKYRAVDKFMSEKIDELVPKECWYLSIIGLKKEYRNKGLGIELMKEVLLEADKAGAPVYLETFTPRNISFYKRFGFEALEPIWEPTIQEWYYIMIRQALHNSSM